MHYSYVVLACAMTLFGNATCAEQNQAAKDKESKKTKKEKHSHKDKKRSSFEFNQHQMVPLAEALKNRLFLVINAAHDKPNPLESMSSLKSHANFKVFEVNIPDSLHQICMLLNHISKKSHHQDLLKAFFKIKLESIISELEEQPTLKGIIKIDFFSTHTAAQHVFVKLFSDLVKPQSIFYFANPDYVDRATKNYLDHLEQTQILVFNHEGSPLSKREKNKFHQAIKDAFGIN
ncbi:MAG: hypothetical protein H6679_02755 [Epsilonproteobacteria bacterium]|nr:hypothetical protein [Campylobacterota bacterium]